MMKKIEAQAQVLENTIRYLGTANQRYVYPHYNEQQIKKLVTESTRLANKLTAKLVAIDKKEGLNKNAD